MADKTGSNNSFPTCSEIRDIQRIQTSGEPVISAMYQRFSNCLKPLITPTYREGALLPIAAINDRFLRS
jgi:hypothetical protein